MSRSYHQDCERWFIRSEKSRRGALFLDGGLAFDVAPGADLEAAAIYGTWPPLVNATRKAGEWQAYDIVFEAPKWEGEKLVKPASITVFHNGILVHHKTEYLGRAIHARVPTYAPHAAEEPLSLQNHGSVVRYRNIWVRKLKGYDQQ